MCWVPSVSQDLLFRIHDGEETHVESLRSVRGAGQRSAQVKGLEARDHSDHGLTGGSQLLYLSICDARLELEQD